MHRIGTRRIIGTAALATALIAGAAGLAWAQPAGDAPARQREQRNNQPGGQQPGGGGGDDRPQRGQQPGGPGGGRAASVEGAMRQMNRAYRALKAQIGDASKTDENLRLAGQMQMAAALAKNANLSEDALKNFKTDAEKTAAREKFRRTLIQAMRLMLDMEEQIMAGDTASAKATLEKVHDLEEEGHEMFGVSEEEEHADEEANRPRGREG